MAEEDWKDVDIDNNDWVDVEEEKSQRFSPFKFAVTPISKLISGKSILEHTQTAERRKNEMTAFAEKRALAGKPASVGELMFRGAPSALVESAIDLADVSPADIAIGSVVGAGVKGISKIPFRGSTVGEIAKNVPLSRHFLKNIDEYSKYQQWLKGNTPLSSRGVQEIVVNPIDKIRKAIEEAVPVRGEQEALYTAERKKRIAKVVGVGEKIPGEEGYFAQLSALKGELPKVKYTGIRDKVLQSDIDYLFNSVEQNQILLPFEKISTKNGLAKLLGKEGISPPTESEITLLNEVFPKEFIQTILNKRSLLQKGGQAIGESFNLPRAMMASVDMSAPLRQGAFLIGRPKQWLPAFKEQFKYFFSEKAYQDLIPDIQKRPTYLLMRESGLAITDLGRALANREEKFMSNLAEKIPLMGRLVRASGRAYTGFLDKLRADVFDDLITKAIRSGKKVEGKVANDIAKFINSATGRGDLGILNRSAVALNSVFFSPRLMASRVNLLNPAFYINLDPFVRKEAIKSLLTFAGTGMSVLGLAHMGGAEIGVDPRSADFGKIKIDNTRYDIFGGFQQYIRMGAQLITGKHISSTTGTETTLGEGYKPMTRLDIIQRFIETKESPVMSFATMLLKGQTSMGKDINLKSEIAQRFIPMVVQDMVDLYEEKGLIGVMMGSPAIFGVGVQTYSPDAEEMVNAMNSVIMHHRELLNRGKIQDAQSLWDRNRNIIEMGVMLKPYQETINQYGKIRDFLNKNITVPNFIKLEKSKEIDEKVKQIKIIMSNRFKEIKETKSNWVDINNP